MEMNIFVVLTAVLAFFSPAIWGQKVPVPEEQRTAPYWVKEGQKTLLQSIMLKKIENKAKNVIFFLGDGMGMTTVTAMRIFKGQKNGKIGEEELLTFDQFPHVSLSKTYGIDRQTSDSANTATAYLCGVKSNYGTIGLDGRAEFGNCSSTLDPTTHVDSILKWAQDAGKWTGFVTTTRVTHATPAGLYAHTADRDWESTTPDLDKCKDIAQQMIQDPPGKDIRVIMGGGVKHFIPDTKTDVHGKKGSRVDSKDLLEEWKRNVQKRGARGRQVFDVEELRSLDPNDVDYLMGLFHTDHLPYVADRPGLERQYPTIAEMTKKAIQILSRSPNGYFLLVEGGSIDLAHHLNYAQKALIEGVEFDKAISAAVKATDMEDTLIIVTADHSHTFTFGGDYPLRGTPIIGIGGVSDMDNLTFTSLGYHNGPAYRKNARQRNLTQEEATSKDFQMDSALPFAYETHGGEDVAVYALGPMAHLFHGVHDQSYIPYVLSFAQCIGPSEHLCNGGWSFLSSHKWNLTIQLLSAVIGLHISKIMT